MYTIKSFYEEYNSNVLIEGNRIKYFNIRFYRYSCYRLQIFYKNYIVMYTRDYYHHICHGVGPFVDPFQSHISRSLFCPLGSSVSLPWVSYFEAFYLYVVPNFSFIPLICPKLVLFLTPL